MTEKPIDKMSFEEALNETSRDYAPWYAIPADAKPYMRETVADILIRTLRQLDFQYPEPDEKTVARFEEMRKELEAD